MGGNSLLLIKLTLERLVKLVVSVEDSGVPLCINETSVADF